MKKFSLAFYLLVVFNINSYAQSILNPGTYSYKTFNLSQKNAIEINSASFQNLSKISSITSSSPHVHFSSIDFWPSGAWGRGYYSYMTDDSFYSYQEEGVYRGCHPLMRDASIFLKGHLHLYLSGHTSGNSLQLVKNGIDYILTQQYNSGTDKGSFDWWLNREGQTNISMGNNSVEAYETAYALSALSEFYLSGINYKRSEVYSAIQYAL